MNTPRVDGLIIRHTEESAAKVSRPIHQVKELIDLARDLERENAELLELCKRALTQSARVHPDFMRDLQDAIAKVEGK